MSEQMRHAVTVGPWAVEVTVGPGQRLCMVCGGASFILERGRVEWCRACIRGVQRLCVCGEPTTSGAPYHDCDGARAARRAREDANERERFEKAEKLTVEQAAAAGVKFLTFDAHDAGDMFPVADLADMAAERGVAGEAAPAYAWATYPQALGFNVGDILENECEQLHEEALESIAPEAVKELQDYLDGWAERHGGDTTTYWPDEKRAVLVPTREAPADAR